MKAVLIFVVVAVLVLLLGVYLAPDDLAQCEPRPSAQVGCQSADAIVAVSGGDTQARTAEAVKLYHAGWANTVVFSGAAADKSGPSNASAMRLQAVQAGVPKEAIITEGDSETTRQNAQLASDVFAEHSFRRVILVTSAYHQRRASIEFRQYVAADTEIVNHPVRHDKQWSQWWWLTPTGWWLALSELVKVTLVYIGAPR